MSTSTQQMQSVEQAVFTSSARSRMKGYQLVGKSAGIDREIGQELCRWAPTRRNTDNPDDWAISSFSLPNDLVAITRTTSGGPEYSDRGGRQIVTRMLVLRYDQLEGYDFNVIAFARTAIAMGGLTLPLDLDAEQLAPVRLATFRIDSDPSPRGRCTTDATDRLIDHAATLIAEGRHVALVGATDPISTANQLIQRLPFQSRREFSVTTGLEPSIQRPFQCHFIARSDIKTRRTLDSQKAIYLDFSKPAEVPELQSL